MRWWSKQSRRSGGLCFLTDQWSVKNPLISGRITATSGTLNFRNDRYDITRAFIDLPEKRMQIRC